MKFGTTHAAYSDRFRQLTDDQMRFRPHPELNSIAWLLWHMARSEDMAVKRAGGSLLACPPATSRRRPRIGLKRRAHWLLTQSKEIEMTTLAIREFIAQDMTSVAGFAALAAVLDARAAGVPLDPALAAQRRPKPTPRPTSPGR